MTISQYLGRGSTSRGALSINGALSIYVSKPPYLHTQADIDAVVTSLNDMKQAISKVPSITWEVPANNMTMEEYLDSVRIPHCSYLL